MRFVLQGDGQFTNACAVDSAISDPELFQCLTTAFARIEIAEYEDRCGITTVTYPLIFTP